MVQISKRKQSKRKQSKRKQSKRKQSKRKQNRRYLKGGSLLPLDVIYPANEGRTPRWRIENEQWTTLVRVQGLNLFGTSLPHWNQAQMENIFRFYLFRKGIKRVISLQGCGSLDQPPPWNNVQSCGSGFDLMLEDRVFHETKNMSPVTQHDPHVEIVYHTIADMAAGSIVTWAGLTQHYVDACDEMTIVHCYAGFGRSGSVLLYFILNKYGPGAAMWGGANGTQPWIGLADSNAMLVFLRDILRTNLVIDDNVRENSLAINQAIALFNPTEIVDEVFKYNTLFNVNLMISRINLIIICLAARNQVAEGAIIVLYQKYTPADWLPPRRPMFVPRQCVFRYLTDEFLNTEFTVPAI
jgi:hypothetical protein